jgi:hypothetical protein
MGTLPSSEMPHIAEEPGEAAAEIPPEWLAEFEAAARRDLRTRFRYSFIRTYKPVMDDESFRAFDTTADYRSCAKGTCLTGSVMAAFEYRQAEEIRDTFARHDVPYLFVWRRGDDSLRVASTSRRAWGTGTIRT